MRRIGMVALTCVAVGMTAASADARERASLRGSATGMVRQNRVAKDHGYDFYGTKAEVEAAVSRGELVELPGNEDYEVADFVRHPYARPEVRLFVERLGAQYHEACGQKLVITSLTRPASGQPSNAHALSVHPAGMAVDLRVSDRSECRRWLESTLLALERRGVVDGIREYHPPHYHVAVFPGPYREYVDELLAEQAAAEAEARERAPAINVRDIAPMEGGEAIVARDPVPAAVGMDADSADEARTGGSIAGPLVLLAGAAFLLAGPLVLPLRFACWLPRLELARRPRAGRTCASRDG